jgi:hypothetical protein
MRPDWLLPLIAGWFAKAGSRAPPYRSSSSARKANASVSTSFFSDLTKRLALFKKSLRAFLNNPATSPI